jgi:hypothetical protein
MSARRSTTQTVQLFPFLAVLVCVMGALIFLLLVTTRRIRQQAIERAAVVELQQQFEAGLLVPPPEAAPILPEVEPPELVVPPIVIPTDEPLPEPVPLPPAGPTAAELRAEWDQIVAALQADREQLESRLRQAEASSEDEDARAAALEAQLQDLQRRRGQLQQVTTQLRDTGVQAAQSRAQLERELSRLDTELRRVRAEQAQASGKYSIVSYDGQSGTTRRPIVIECTEAGLTFAAEGITITPQQLNGFTPTYNPLLAGTEALMTYWAARDLKDVRSGEAAGRPYVLLVVRPGGTTGYYVARRLLEGLDQPFGYELVTEGQQFAWPETDPAAAQSCRLAVDAMIAQRDRLMAQTRTGRMPVAAQLQFAGEDGRFYLDEVERLRRGQKTVHVGGRQFERAPQPSSPSSPRIVDVPRGDGAADTAAPRQLNPAPTARAAEKISRNMFEAAITARRAGRDAAGAPHDAGRPVPAPGSGSIEERAAGAESEGEGTARAEHNPDSRGHADVAPGSSSQAASSIDSWESATSRSPTGNVANWEPRRRDSQQPEAGAAGSGRQSPSGSTAAPQGPEVPRSPITVLQSRGGEADHDADVDVRQWGIRDIGSSIGLEREVVVRIGAAQVQVAGDKPIQITSGMSREELQEQLAARLDAHVRGWGRPPKSFYWLPTVRFQVLPGGIQYQERLSGLTDDWGLQSSVEQVLE